MDKVAAFLAIMASLSTASQTLTEHLLKKRFAYLADKNKSDSSGEGKRQSAIHLLCGLIGGLLCGTAGLHPLLQLSQDAWWVRTFPWFEYIICGVLVSYGGSFFNEALDSVREFKKTQESLRPKT